MSAALDTLAALRIEAGPLLIDVAEPWQLQDLREVLGGEAPFNFLGRPRAGSKTTDLAAVGTCWLTAARPGDRFYSAASDRDQARLLIAEIEGFARRTPSVGAALTIDRYRVTAHETGATLEALAADSSSSWGLRPAGIVIDELAWWPDVEGSRTLVDSLLSSAAKTPGCRVAVITSPSSTSHFAYKLREHASSDRLWRLSERRGLIEWLDPQRVEEQRRRLSDTMFRRLFLGEWVDGDEALVSAEALAAAVLHEDPLEPSPEHRYVIGLDLGLKRDRTAAAVAHAEDERIVLDRIEVWSGNPREPVQLDAVEEWLVGAAQRYNGASVIADPWQSVGLLQRLNSHGIHGEEYAFSATSVGRLASSLFNLLRDHRLALPNDAALLDELAHVRLRETSPGVFRVDHDPSRHDDMTIALALAAHNLQSTSTSAAMAVAFPVDVDGDLDMPYERMLQQGRTDAGSFTSDLLEREW